MRALTEAEAKTIAVLLGSATAPERERLNRSALPRSTYHAARRKAYREGWLRDRYVPEPERLGVRWAVLILAKPFADRQDELSQIWGRRPENVLTLRGSELQFGVFLFADRDEALRWKDGTGWADRTSASMPILADLTGPSVPVFFDFEGLWTHLTGLSGNISYPRGLGGSSAPEEGGKPLSEHQLWAAAELLHRPFADPALSIDGHLIGPLGLPFSQRRLVANGWVNHRVFLDPGRLSPYKGSAADLYAFISGTLKPGARPEVLFHTLVRECRVFPFLYVVGPDRLMVGAMGNSAARAPVAGTSDRRPVLPTLQESIQGIEIVQAPANLCQLEVDHRYDRLLARRRVG